MIYKKNLYTIKQAADFLETDIEHICELLSEKILYLTFPRNNKKSVKVAFSNTWKAYQYKRMKSSLETVDGKCLPVDIYFEHAKIHIDDLEKIKSHLTAASPNIFIVDGENYTSVLTGQQKYVIQEYYNRGQANPESPEIHEKTAIASARNKMDNSSTIQDHKMSNVFKKEAKQLQDIFLIKTSKGTYKFKGK